MTPDNYDDWYDANPIIGGPALHQVSGEPAFTIIRSRPIGYGANIDVKPIIRVKAITKKISGACG